MIRAALIACALLALALVAVAWIHAGIPAVIATLAYVGLIVGGALWMHMEGER